MGETKWTEEQYSAIYTSGANLLVAAAAGSGKTAVLVERIIKKITDEKKPIDIDKLLVVTFTNAAAAEMRERIGEAIAKEIEKNPESKVLQEQLSLLNKASITTIHSFCLEVIKNNFYNMDMDPDFRIADATEAVLLKQETIEELFEEYYVKQEELDIFHKLVECYGGKKDDKELLEIVLSLYEFVMSGPWPEKWLKGTSEDFNPSNKFSFEATAWGSFIIEYINEELINLKGMLLEALEICSESTGLEPYAETINLDLVLLDNLQQALTGSWDQIYNSFKDIQFTTIKRCGKAADKTAQGIVKEIRDKVKDRVQGTKDKSNLKAEFFSLSPEDIEKNFEELYPLIAKLCELVLDFKEKYAEKKKSKGLLDFNDLEHFCLKILSEEKEDKIVPSPVALALREKYEEILIDEYQDSNQVQEEMLGLVSRKDGPIPNLFMVGDVKQSIYRFRQAEPELFLNKYNSYSMEEGALNRKITLFKNFRSRDTVLDGVNFIFKSIMSKRLGELDYDDSEALNLGADYKSCTNEKFFCGGKLELNIVETNSKEVENEEESEEDVSNIQLEARVVAQRIQALMAKNNGQQFAVFDKNINDYRPVEYKDIVILMRATSSMAPTFVEELSKFDIPVYADTGSGYFETIEIKTIMSILQVIDNPLQDIPLLAALRAPVFSFSAEELIDIRMVNKEGYFYEALKQTAEENFEELSKKAETFINLLNSWREKAVHMPVDELIWSIYSDTGYYGYVAAMPGGIQRQANLRILFERGTQYEKTSFKGLFNFINFINRLRKGNGDMGSAKILGENENVVRIMSIHKSKGLEFPVVILAGTGKRFNLMDINRNILFHKQLGLGPNYVDPERRIKYSSINKLALKYKIKLENLSEEMRILYVALTRAKEKLIITGSARSLESSAKKWIASDRQKKYALTKANCYLDWLCIALAKHVEGGAIRDILAQESSRLVEDASKWDINIIQKNAFLTGLEEKQIEEDDTIQVLMDKIKNVKQQPSNSKEEIYRRLEWKYSLDLAPKLPAKLTVTELKRLAATELLDEEAENIYKLPVLNKKPEFLKEKKGLSASEKGTATHWVMQHLGLSKVGTLEDMQIQIEEFQHKKLLSDEQASSVKLNKIHSFFTSSLGKRMLKADTIYRETPFFLEIGSMELYQELPEDKYGNEKLMLQGIIDCFFEENQGIVLIDYKTDYVPSGEEALIKERYRVQIEYYARALEKITSKKIINKYIYLFSNGEIIEY